MPDLLSRSVVAVYNLDAADLIKGVIPSLPQKSLVYLDPPYYVKAEGLYKNFYKHDDHVAIAKLVRSSIPVPWIVSYDYNPKIIEMYQGCPKIVYGMNYSAGETRYKGSEVMFFSKNLSIPDQKNPAKLEAA